MKKLQTSGQGIRPTCTGTINTIGKFMKKLIIGQEIRPICTWINDQNSLVQGNISCLERKTLYVMERNWTENLEM